MKFLKVDQTKTIAKQRAVQLVRSKQSGKAKKAKATSVATDPADWTNIDRSADQPNHAVLLKQIQYLYVTNSDNKVCCPCI